MKRLLLFFLVMFITIIPLSSLKSNDLEITREFTLITSDNATGYLKPLFTTIGEGLNTSLYNTAYHSNGWSFGFNLSLVGMLIPDSHKNYDAKLPDLYGNPVRVKTAGMHDGRLIENFKGTIQQPTIYGGNSYSIFASPQGAFPPDSFYKSVGFLEGNNIGMMPGLPILQMYIGLPTRSELRFRFLTLPVQDSPLTYFTIGANQNIDKEFGLQEPDNPLSYGLTAAFHSISRPQGISISSFAFGVNASNKFSDEFQVYGGLQFETFSGNIELIRTDFNPNDVVNSPFSEIRNGENLKIDVQSYNFFRLTAGASYDLPIIRLHGDISWAAQPVFNFGVSLKIFEHKEEFFKPREYFTPDMDEMSSPRIAFNDFTTPYIAKAAPVSKYVPKEFDFRINLEMQGEYEGNLSKLDTIVIEEFESRQTRAILPYIFFDQEESNIPSKYHLITRDKTSSFNFSELSGKSSLESYYDVLNVIAHRLKDRPNANLTLTGTNNNIGKEKNNKKLSKQRADNIKDYLVNVWNIEESRIIVKAQNLPTVPSNSSDVDGQAENRRVEISSNDIEITAPVFIVDTLLRVKPESIKYLPKINSEAGLARWSINSSSGNTKLREMSGEENIESLYNWMLASEGTRKKLLSSNLITRFVAYDKENQMQELTLINPVKVISVKDKRLNATKDTSLNMYNLILFDFNKSDLNIVNKRITDFIKSELTPNTDVTIYGYTDRIGNDDYNLKLSTARAESTGKALGGHPYKTVGVGESKLIYDNDLPEGRFYCRTVVVEAKVPIN